MSSTDKTRPRRSSRQRARRRRLVLAAAVSVVGAVGALLADAAPTGIAVADGAYRALYVLAVALACGFARRWTWPIVAGGALLAGPDGAWAWGAGIGLLISVGTQFDSRRRQPVGAVIGVLAAHALLRLPPAVAFGVPSLIAAVVPLPAVVSALVMSRSRVRRPVLIAGGAVAGVGVLMLVGFGAGVLLIRADANAGVDSSQAGLAALRAGDQAGATAAFADAASAFADANDTANAWWMAPARIVPVLGPHVDAAQILTEEGAALAEVSARTAPAVSLDDLTTDDGRFRLDRIAELEPLARDVVTALVAGQETLATISTGWLTGPMDGAIERLRDEIAGALPDARTAVDAFAVAPALLGDDSPKHYVVLFANPAEARSMGGFVASIGVLTADDGKLDFDSLETPALLSAALRDRDAELSIDVPTAVAAAQPARFVENWTDSPDIATVSDVVADLFPQLPAGATADGVLYADPYVLAALLEITGPVTIPETGEQVTAETAVDFLLRDQYRAEQFEPGGARKERLGDAGEIAFGRLTSGRLPRPRLLADVLAPLVQARRLLFTTVDPAAHDLLERIGLRPPVDGGADETVLVAHGNRRANKLDAYLERHIAYDAAIDENGNVDATVTVELTNTAPRRGLVPYQVTQGRDDAPATSNVLSLEVYSAFDETAVLVDGQPSPYNDLVAYGLNHSSIPVTVDAGSTAVVQVRLRGTVDPASCRFSFVPNAGSSPDTLRAAVVTPDGTRTIEKRTLDRRLLLWCESN